MHDSRTKCTVCEEDVIDELQCSVCKYPIHTICALGFQPPEGFLEAENIGQFKCAPCICGTRYELIHIALDAHQKCRTDHPSPIRGRANDVDHDESELAFNQESAAVISGSSIQPTVADNSGVTPPSQTLPLPSQQTPSVTNGEAPATAVNNDTSSGRSDNAQNSHQPTHLGSGTSFITPHKLCEGKGKRLSYILNSMFQHLPDHATTIFIGDSLIHCLKKTEVDPTSDSVRIRSVGGLCVVAVVQALLRHKRKHPKIKRVVYSCGINDHLHRDKHCHEEKSRYFKALEVESARVFPNAGLSFVIPFKGMVGHSIDNTVQSDLRKLLKENSPKLKCCIPPSLVNKVDEKGIHPNVEGKKVLTNYYSKNFIPRSNRVFNQDSGRRALGVPYSAAHLPPGNQPTPVPAATHSVPENFRVPNTYQQVKSVNQDQPLSLTPGMFAREIAGAYAQMMQMWGHQPPQYPRYQAQPPWPPP